jgi:hypothetical protein
MKRLSLCLAGAAFVAASTVITAQTPAKAKDEIVPQPITLTGCVAAGTAKNTYMLSNVKRSDTTPGSPGAPDVGVYWLNAPEKLKGHVGHQVEVMGRLEKDTDMATVKTNKDGKVELTSERGTKKVTVPQGTSAAAAVTTVGADGVNGKQVNYNVKVDSVKMTSATCN